MKGLKIVLFLAVILAILATKFYGLPSSQPKSFPSRGALNGYLPLETFKHQFNEVSSLNIRDMQLLQDDSVTTSYLYSFTSDLALSLLVENSTGSVIEVILVTTLDPENRPFMENTVYACDPSLSQEERAQIVSDLVQSPHFIKNKDSTVIKNQILYRLQEYGSYVKLSAEPI